MNTPRSLLAASLFALSACASPIAGTETEPGFFEELPEGLAETAAPGQPLHSVRIQPQDGCYWYEHVGPVETTLLPLISRSGGMICSRQTTQ